MLQAHGPFEEVDHAELVTRCDEPQPYQRRIPVVAGPSATEPPLPAAGRVEAGLELLLGRLGDAPDAGAAVELEVDLARS